MPQNRTRILIAAFTACLLLGAGVFIGLRGTPPPLPEHVHSPDERLPIPAFALQDMNGESFSENRLRGHWSVLFFGYTECPDVCPSTLQTLKQFTAQLRNNSAGPPQVMFISLDPYRDTPEKLREFVQFFDPSFVAVTGAANELSKLATPISGPYDYEDVDTGELIRDPSLSPPGTRYHVNHSGSLFFVAPDGNLAAFALPPHDVPTLITTYEIVRKRYDSWF